MTSAVVVVRSLADTMRWKIEPLVTVSEVSFFISEGSVCTRELLAHRLMPQS